METMIWPGIAGRRALVTGGSRGIGRAVARALLESGAEVIVTARTSDAAEAAARELSQERARGIALDLSDTAQTQQALDSLAAEVKQAGGLDLLVLNAGMTRDGLIMRMSLDQWEEVLRANLTGSFLVTKTFLPGMIRSRFGRIVMLSSVVARMGNAGQSNYAASKAGMIGLVRSLAREVAARGITVNAVAPGFVDTDMTRSLPEAAREGLLQLVPLARLGEVADIASAVLFLLSDAAGYITGEVLDVNGGMDM